MSLNHTEVDTRRSDRTVAKRDLRKWIPPRRHIIGAETTESGGGLEV